MIDLRVWRCLPDASLRPVGIYQAEDFVNPRRPRQARFVYDEAYDGPALQPDHHIQGSPSQREYRYNQAPHMPGALEDALPDAWGRALLAKTGISPEDSPGILASGRAGELGALRFSLPDQEPAQARREPTPLGDLLAAAEEFEATGNLGDAELRALLAAGSSTGGARPKALIDTEDGHWIAKFPSRKDRVNICGIEAACLALARDAGLQTPDSHLVKVARRRVLLVRRFDISPQGGRYHRISMATATGFGAGTGASYWLYARALRQHAADPVAACQKLFRLMVFNAAIGNTDDHERNFSMLYSETGWDLAPAYDLLPDVNNTQDHASDFDGGPGCPNWRGLSTMAASFGIPIEEALEDAMKIIGHVEGYAKYFQKENVPAEQIKHLGKDIVRRLSLLRS